MNAGQVVKEAMELRNHSAATLADKLGYAFRSGVTERMRKKNEMRISTLLLMLDALDCELIVRSNGKDRKEWIISREDVGESK